MGDLVHLLPQIFEVSEAGRAIRIDHEQTSPPRMQHAMADRATLACVLQELHDADITPRRVDGELERELRRAVRAPVVDDDEFVCAALRRGLCKVIDGILQHAREPLGLVVGGDNDAEVKGGCIGDAAYGKVFCGRARRAIGLLGRVLLTRGRGQEYEGNIALRVSVSIGLVECMYTCQNGQSVSRRHIAMTVSSRPRRSARSPQLVEQG